MCWHQWRGAGGEIWGDANKATSRLSDKIFCACIPYQKSIWFQCHWGFLPPKRTYYIANSALSSYTKLGKGYLLVTNKQRRLRTYIEWSTLDIFSPKGPPSPCMHRPTRNYGRSWLQLTTTSLSVQAIHVRSSNTMSLCYLVYTCIHLYNCIASSDAEIELGKERQFWKLWGPLLDSFRCNVIIIRQE